MKALSKPLSSPGRPDKFPPPLMRFLRSNAGSRSRGRSRSSPIFHLRSKKRPPGGVIEATQEPSSPKVTCIGQVRVRRKQNDAVENRRRRSRSRRCIWFNKTLFRCRSPKSLCRWFFRKWSSIFRSNCCIEASVAEGGSSISRVCSDRKIEKIENQSVSVSGGNTNTNNNTNTNSNNNISNYNYKIRNSFSSNDSETEFYRSNKNNGENGGDVFGESKRGFLESSSSSSSPPRNALLLTRCRSAPYGSSTLGGRFWAEEKLEEIERRKSSAELDKPRFEGNSSSNEEIEKIDGLKAKNRGIEVHPLKLTRCKSEPALKAERFGITEETANFLRLRRSEGVILSLFPK